MKKITSGRLERWIEILNRAYERRDWEMVGQVVAEMQRDAGSDEV